MKTKTISYVLFASAVILFLSIPKIANAASSDSAMIRPGPAPTQGVLQPAGLTRFEKNITYNTVNEYEYGACPSGYAGVSTGTSYYIQARRTVTTYYLNGQITGVVPTPWEDVDEDCYT